jgi:phage terminase Nu1 subunit (DNA packaging protein)
MGQKLDDLEQIVVTASVLCDLIGISDRRVRQLAQEGVLIRVAKGRYSLAKSIKGYITNLKVTQTMNQDKKDASPVDLDIEKAKHERIKRQLSENKLSLQRGKLHRAEDVERVMTDMLMNFKGKILNIPTRLAVKLTNQRDENHIEEIIREACIESLQEFSEYNPELFYSADVIVDGEGEIDEKEEDDPEKNA